MLGKILSFPIRFIIFMIVGLLAGIILLLNRTVGMVCAIASHIVKFLGVLVFSLLEIACLLTFVPDIINKTADRPIIEYVIFMALILLVIALFYYLPNFIEKLYVWAELAGTWLWGAAKAIMFWDKSHLYVI